MGLRRIKMDGLPGYGSDDEIIVNDRDYAHGDKYEANRKDREWLLNNLWNVGSINHGNKTVSIQPGYYHFAGEIAPIAEKLGYMLCHDGYRANYADKTLEITPDYPEFDGYSPNSALALKMDINKAIERYREKGFRIVQIHDS